MEIVGYLASVLMGISLGMIGGGGSILTVPILVYLFGIHPVTSTAYSLFIVGSTALVGGLSYLKKGEVDLKTGFIFAVPSFIGVYLTRAYVVPALPDVVFQSGEFQVSKPLLIMAVFAILMLAASFSMIRTKKAEVKEIEMSAFNRILLISFEGLVVGGVTGFVGAGGGFLIIPALVVLVGLPMKMAVGTSLFIIAAKSLIGFLGDLQTHTEFDWRLLLSVTGIAVGGLFLGIVLSKKVSEKGLKKGFGYFVLIMGTFVLIDQLRRLL
jgi:uncharacterized membrane protein YfcA